MRDDKGPDDKIVAVHVDDPEYSDYGDISDLPPHRLKELRQFFLDYKELEGKTVEVGPLRGHLDAENAIRAAISRYRQTTPTRGTA
jgi:inorganic pyrophosphatase